MVHALSAALEREEVALERAAAAEFRAEDTVASERERWETKMLAVETRWDQYYHDRHTYIHTTATAVATTTSHVPPPPVTTTVTIVTATTT